MSVPLPRPDYSAQEFTWRAAGAPLPAVAANQPPPADMPPLALMVLDALADDAETIYTMRDYGGTPASGIALAGEEHLLEALRGLLAAGLAEVESEHVIAGGRVGARPPVGEPGTADDDLRRYWFRMTPQGRATWEQAGELIDAYWDRYPFHMQPGRLWAKFAPDACGRSETADHAARVELVPDTSLGPIRLGETRASVEERLGPGDNRRGDGALVEYRLDGARLHVDYMTGECVRDIRGGGPALTLCGERLADKPALTRRLREYGWTVEHCEPYTVANHFGGDANSTVVWARDRLLIAGVTTVGVIFPMPLGSPARPR